LQAVTDQMDARGMTAALFKSGSKYPILAIVSMMAMGLGYFGQPHILTRFMSVKSIPKLRQASLIAIVWVFVSLIGAIFVGVVAIGMFTELGTGEHEKVFIFMIEGLFNPWVGGIMLAAIMSAIMSTIDSQLLVSSSALTEDFYQKVIKKDASEKEVVFVGRICVMIISAIALALAMDENSSILGIVAYAWGGLGAAFGPVVFFALFSRKTTWFAALAGMVTGTVVLVVWERLGYGGVLYEIVPGFAANCLTIWTVNSFVSQKDSQVIKTFEEVKNTLK
jgi:sodium/proline symporter